MGMMKCPVTGLHCERGPRLVCCPLRELLNMDQHSRGREVRGNHCRPAGTSRSHSTEGRRNHPCTMTARSAPSVPPRGSSGRRFGESSDAGRLTGIPAEVDITEVDAGGRRGVSGVTLGHAPAIDIGNGADGDVGADTASSFRLVPPGTASAVIWPTSRRGSGQE